MLNEDYKDMLSCLLEERVSFLLVGAYAVAVYGHPRATKDMDIFVRAEQDNASKLMRALHRFGAPLTDVTERDFRSEGTVFQIGTNPRRIDILTRISGIDFERAYAKKNDVEIEGLKVPVISLEDLIANKRASGRTQDLADVEKLEALKRESSGPASP
jgi:predicted nucleotidyltransferase